MSERSVDLELVRRVQQGDKGAFDLLVLKYQSRVTKLVFRYVPNPSDALDLTQDTFLKAYRAIGRFRGDSAFYTWLHRIAINTAKNFLVSQRRRPYESDIDDQPLDQLDGRAGISMRETATPENLLLRDEVEATVHRAIDGLSDELRTAIKLREFEGMSYEEIAEMMECPVGTVRSRIFRARETISSALDALME